MPAPTRESWRRPSPTDARHARGPEVLELQRATRFIPTKAENYKGIEAAARNAGC
jgi:phosphonate transport system substrate-binding protein